MENAFYTKTVFLQSLFYFILLPLSCSISYCSLCLVLLYNKVRMSHLRVIRLPIGGKSVLWKNSVQVIKFDISLYLNLCYRKTNSEIFFFLINLFIYFWLCWVFVSVQGLSLVAASGGHSSSRCMGLSLSRPLLLRSTGSGRAGSVVVAHGPSCSTACGIFPDQGSNPCALHWQVDS